MPIHFERSELVARRQQAIKKMEAQGLDGILMFKQESMYYLTGYDTFGFCFFQKTLGCEYNAYGLSAAYGKLLDTAMTGFNTLVDTSTLVSELRVVKSETELQYVRRAAELADDAMDAAIQTAGPGVFEGNILAAMQGAVFKGGGDYAGNEFIIGSGPGALLCRYFSGRETIGDQDQLTLEYGGAYRRYHACLMQTFLTGQPGIEHVNMHAACSDAMDACLEAIVPGQTMGTVFDEHARVLDAAGFRNHRMNACGYSLGAMYTPMWMDFPMFYTNNPYVMQTNNIFFVHIILMNSDTGNSMTLGQTVRVTEVGAERLSRQPTDLVVV
jgi:Xaa-Pro dipeptidase